MTTGLRPYYDSLRAAGKIYQHRVFRSGSVYDLMNTGRVLTNTGTQLQRNGLFIPLGQVAYEDVPLPALTEFTVLAKIRVDATTADGTATATVIGTFSDTGLVGWQDGIFSDGGTLKHRISVKIGASLRSVFGDVYIPGDLHWRGIHYDASNFATMTKDAVVTATLADAGALGQSTIDGIQLGKRVGGTKYNQMLCSEIIVTSQRLTTVQEAVLYAELDDTVYESNNLIGNKDYPTIGTSVWEARYGLLAGETTMSAGQSLGQLDPLKVVSGTHKATTFLYNGVLAKGIKCVTAGNIILPDTVPDKGTIWVYRYYDDSAGAWETRTSASATVSLDAVNDLILWCDINSQNYLYKY